MVIALRHLLMHALGLRLYGGRLKPFQRSAGAMPRRTKLPTEHSGFHRGIFYSVTKDPLSDRWRYSFSIGNDTMTGTVKVTLGLLAVRRVRMLIDRALREKQHA